MRIDDLVAILRQGEGITYDGEAVDELSHALQCAALAKASGADEEVIVAALLHDVGRAPEVRELIPGAAHERLGAEICRPLFGERVGWLVSAHVAAKRYLVSVEPGYAGRLSPASLKSLVSQGGRFTAGEVDAFQSHAWWEDAVRLRRWDDQAKVPAAPEPPLEDMAALLQRAAVIAHKS